MRKSQDEKAKKNPLIPDNLQEVINLSPQQDQLSESHVTSKQVVLQHRIDTHKS